MSDQRLKPVAPEAYTPAQKACADDFQKVRKTGFSGGPWGVFIHSPELMTHAQRMGDYLRFRCPLSGKLSDPPVKNASSRRQGTGSLTDTSNTRSRDWPSRHHCARA